MTYEDFIKKFNRTNFLDKYWSYFISIGALGIGLYFLYLLNFTEWYQLKKVTTKNITPLWAIYAFCGLFIFLGLYGFWIIPKNYGITYIKSDSPIDKKAEIINQLIHDLN
ncbi:hypothetical protein [Pedobacter glucosidilyticus]|uniref:hypothetical protein n=1 Tax=Pedobacter glucosidilyticus TaxID=1122941 RepID=UPI0004792F3A|nr:hypothetical protein [Pedobacter glucosidilyticus]